jgi:xanthine dehydrogenase small subunit
VTRDAVNDALAGNLCRCTGYRPIVDAALLACAGDPDDSFSERASEATVGLQNMNDSADVVVGDPGHFFASPASEESLAALVTAHPDAVLLGGATDVGLWVTKNMVDLDKVIWLGRVAGLREIEDGTDALRIGAMVSHADAFAGLAAIDPDIGEIVRRFGSMQVRASGTVGGNIANGSPIGDLAPVLIALDAELELRSIERVRTIALERFFIAYRQQDRQPGEYVRRVIVPKLKANENFRAYKVTKRFDEDISACLGAFRFTLDDRRIASARVAFGGMAGTPKRAPEAEAALVGISLDDAAEWGEALSALGRDYQPLDDHRASAAYRSTVARNLLFRALSETASDETRATRLIGHRDALQAAE